MRLDFGAPAASPAMEDTSAQSQTSREQGKSQTAWLTIVHVLNRFRRRASKSHPVSRCMLACRSSRRSSSRSQLCSPLANNWRLTRTRRVYVSLPCLSPPSAARACTLCLTAHSSAAPLLHRRRSVVCASPSIVNPRFILSSLPRHLLRIQRSSRVVALDRTKNAQFPSIIPDGHASTLVSILPSARSLLPPNCNLSLLSYCCAAIC